MEILLHCYDDQYYCTDEYYELLDKFEERFRYILPCSATDAHGISHGLCFTFSTVNDVIHAYTHILADKWFVDFHKEWPKYYFKVDELDNIRGLDEQGIQCSIDGVVKDVRCC
jgi:hypothetical protein